MDIDWGSESDEEEAFRGSYNETNWEDNAEKEGEESEKEKPLQHFSTGVYSTLERERTTKQKRKLRDGFKARDSSLEREIKKKGIMSCRRVLKSIQALAAHTLLFCFTLFLVLKLDHTLSSSWWSVSSLSLYLSLESLSIVLNWVCMNHLWFGSVFIFEVTHD